ncbi:MAG: terminase small subunit [Clostridium perfringens]|nr:terminase small subunit [Clostridium perfringens]
MARAPNEKVKKAYELFKEGYKLVDISKKLDIPSGTVRRWKKTYNWDNERSDKNSERSLKQNNKKIEEKEPIAEEVKEVLENTELTDKQRLFCIYYIKRFNATKAYQKAYGCSYETALVNGPRLLGNARIQEEIQDLKEGKLNRIMLSEEDIFQKYMDIAFSDIGDYLSFKKVRKNKWTKNEQGEYIPAINPDTGQQDYFEYNVVELNNSKELDTSILQEVSEGKDGVKIKLQDKMKALQWLSDHIGIATEEQKLKIAKLKGEVNKLDGTNENTGPIEIVIKRKGED